MAVTLERAERSRNYLKAQLKKQSAKSDPWSVRLGMILQLLIAVVDWAMLTLYKNGQFRKLFPVTIGKIIANVGMYYKILTVVGCLVPDIIEIVSTPKAELSSIRLETKEKIKKWKDDPRIIKLPKINLPW